MIVKNEEDYLDWCLGSVDSYVDEIIIVDTGSTDDTKKIAARYGAKIYDFKWVDDFSAARNFSFSKAMGDWILWLDADDTVQNPAKLRQLCQTKADAVFLEYYYDIDSKGVVKTKHWRERLIRNNGAMVWKGRLHETLVDKRETTKVKGQEVKILHHADEARRDAALKRNVDILVKQMEEEKNTPDPRTMYNLALCYHDMGMYENAIGLLDIYLTYSGWDEERCQAQCQLGAIKKKLDREIEAEQHYLQAIKEYPTNPVPYVWLGEIYCRQERWQRAYTWLEMALQKPDPSEGMVVWNTLEYTYLPLALYAQACMYLGKIDEALNAIKKAKTFSQDEAITEMESLVKKLKGNQLVSQAIADLAIYLEKNKEPDKVKSLLEAVPKDLLDNPKIVGLRKKIIGPKVWPKQSVAIYTGASGIGEWGPWSLFEGIGGSEEAIIRLSKHLTTQGYQVTIYASPGARAGEYDGVTWLNHWELNAADMFDVFIGWRSPWVFDHRFNARKTYLWLHDVMPEEEFTPERLENISKVIVLSKYHRSLFPNIPDNKIMISANGIDPGEFNLKVERDPWQIFYGSSQTRGLIHLLDIWPGIKAKFPKAHLEIFYGWDSFISLNRDNPERMDWMEKIKQKIAMLDGVTDHGKVSQSEIVTQLLRSNIWAYPTLFPEISCITAMKAQAAGTVPVVNKYAALEETVFDGYALQVEEWDQEAASNYVDLLSLALERTYNDIRRKQIMDKARQKFDWKNVAQSWIKEFKS